MIVARQFIAWDLDQTRLRSFADGMIIVAGLSFAPCFESHHTVPNGTDHSFRHSRQ